MGEIFYVSGTDASSSSPRNPLTDHVDVLDHILHFAAGEGYLFVAGVSKQWKRAWADRPKCTHLSIAVGSPSNLAWARDSGCRWDEVTCSLAAASGRSKTLRYAHSKGCL